MTTFKTASARAGFKTIAAVAGALCVSATTAAFADTTMPQSTSTVGNTTTMGNTMPDGTMSHNWTPIDYSVLYNPVLTQFDIHRARAFGLTNEQIAKVMAVSDQSGVRAGDVLGRLEDGASLPMVASQYGLPPSSYSDASSYEERLRMLERAYHNTGYSRERHMVAGWSGTTDTMWDGTTGNWSNGTGSNGMSSTTGTMAAPGTQDIVGTARAAGNFHMLLRALHRTGLDQNLSGPGPFTVFAPTDDAFAKIPSDQLKAIMGDKAQLTQILEYHVIPGRISAADAMAMTSPTSPATLQGGTLNVITSNGKVTINGANVVMADVQASNGVIHAIDTVLMPVTPTSTGTTTTTTPGK